MSRAHQDAFEETRREYTRLVALLRSAPTMNGDHESPGEALSTLGDAYALLLIAQAEGFLRRYLVQAGVRLPNEPKLNNLINQAVRHYNGTAPRVRIRREEVATFHDLRERRNLYAHGYASRVFPDVPTIVKRLGKFFQHLF